MSAKAKTPGMVIFVGVILIIVGSWSLIGGLCGGGSMAFIALSPEPPGPKAKGQPPDPAAPQRFIAKEVAGYYAVVFSLMAVDMLFGLGQLFAGIGLLRLSSTARMLAILLTLGKLLVSFGGHAYNLLLVLPAQARFFEANPMPQGQGAPFDLGAITQAFTAIILVLVIVIQLIVAATILVVLNRKSTRDAFAAASQPSTEEDERPRSRYEGYDDDDQPPPSPRSPGDTGITDRP
jgi:hypothetical protein